MLLLVVDDGVAFDSVSSYRKFRDRGIECRDQRVWETFDVEDAVGELFFQAPGWGETIF